MEVKKMKTSWEDEERAWQSKEANISFVLKTLYLPDLQIYLDAIFKLFMNLEWL